MMTGKMPLKRAAVALILLVVASGTGFAQNDADWQRVRGIARGREVAVDSRRGDRLLGRLAAVSDSAIVVGVGGRDRIVARAEVRKVLQRVPPPHRGLLVGIGVGLGLAAGFGASVPLFFRQCGRSCADEKAAAAGLVIGLPVAGALAGRHIAGKGDLDLVYLAP